MEDIRKIESLDSIIKEGQIIGNRTLKYIIPGLKLYGKELWGNISIFSTLCTGIKDEVFNMNMENAVFILVNIKGRMVYNKYVNVNKAMMQFYELLSWFNKQPYYIADYPYNSGKDKFLHMLVLRHPVKDAVTKFIAGEYSQIYSNKEIVDLFSKNVREYDILMKTDTGKEELRKYLNFEFNLTGKHELTLSDIDNYKEYDIPPNLNQEVFRWKKTSQLDTTNEEMKISLQEIN